MTDQAPNDPAGDVFARLATIPVPVMAGYLMNELPQTVAAIMLLLPQERAAAIMKGLPPRFFQNVVRRMASSEALLPAPRTVLATVLEREFLPGTARPVTPDRNEEVRRLIALMDPELRDAATAALEPPAETPKTRSSPQPAEPSPWPDWSVEEIGYHEAFGAQPVPLLRIYDHFVRRLSTSMRIVTGLNAEISLHRISDIHQADYLNRLPLPAFEIPFTAEGGGYCGLIAVSPQLIHEMADALLGGTIGIDTSKLRHRPFTTIDRNLFELAANAMLADLSSAFGEVASVTFRLERIETNPSFAFIAPPDASMVQADLSITFEKGKGWFHLLLSDAALEPLREIFSQPIVPPAYQAKPPLVVPTDAGPKLKLATPPAERRNA